MAIAKRASNPTLKSGVPFDLIESDRVEGTTVYRSDGTKIGSIERVMIDKYSGQAHYAVMSFGGFLGLGHDHYPIPWAKLDYNPELGGYEVNITDAELKNAPHFDPGKEWDWADPSTNKQVYEYYRVGGI
jgi:sporulation protein YlmC with PRC-barrel domain